MPRPAPPPPHPALARPAPPAPPYRPPTRHTLYRRACQELPERVFGACHVNKIDLNASCVALPPRSELPG